MINKNALKSVMILKGDTVADLGEALGITYASASRKLNKCSEWNTSQIQIVKDRYDLSAEDIDRIFFTD